MRFFFTMGFMPPTHTTGVNFRFIDANTSKISPNDRRGYDEIFESWQPMLKDPNQVKNFKIVQDLLERKRQN